ncbi:hypothetical protein [Bordetella flabilis]|uniref:Uncharacterized protein n=2 Tax=Bordetella flabilis TaxID=463014 RepID=A0A193GHU0_9BORD|nr:hypothetical protein [Bordetella flabilis]ANN79006.1 hypothetical protein BAU07_19475 [Bordetella flabilis]
MHIPATTPTTPPDRPPIPPRPVRDDLDGLLTAYLSDAAKPHRDKVLDLLRVMDTAPAGRHLLMELRGLAQGGHVPVIDLRAGDAKPLDEAVEGTPVWRLPADAVRQHAAEVGVPPETQHAPAVFWDLISVRNTLVRLAGTSGEPLDPVQLQARFRTELNGGDDPAKTGSAVSKSKSVDETYPPALALHRASVSTIRVVDPRPTSLPDISALPGPYGQDPVTASARTSPSTPADPGAALATQIDAVTQSDPPPSQTVARQSRLVRWARGSLRWLRGLPGLRDLVRRVRPNNATRQDPDATASESSRKRRSATVASLRPTASTDSVSTATVVNGGNAGSAAIPATAPAPTTPTSPDSSGEPGLQRDRNRSGHRRVPSDADALLRNIGK